jgi:hypothetical protein
MGTFVLFLYLELLMSAAGTNPIMSQIMGAAGDLGLSAAAKNEAQTIADQLKKKKMNTMQAAGQGTAPLVGPASAALGLT